ncbi:MAG TPA: S41 family peptidase [Sphingomicrobium sp.]|nr:S41 family peptidase [Sphingomicrobium sp.]
MIRNPLDRRTMLASGLAALASTTILAKAPPGDITLEQDFDELWETLRDRYAFFEDKATDWERVRTLYRPQLAEIGGDEDKWNRLLLAVTDELYDAHTHFAQPVPGLPRWPLSDIFVEETKSGVKVSALREASGALEAGLKVGDVIVGIDGMTFEEAMALRMPQTLRAPDPEARRFAINAAVGGNRERDRRLKIRSDDGRDRDLLVTFRPVADRAAISHRRLDGGFGYIAITTFGESDTPGAFDAALAELKDAPGLVIDTRFNGGGDTAIARPIMGRFIKERRPYALMRRRSGKGTGLTDPWTEYVEPKGPFTYEKPVVVLQDHWSASMAEGFPMGMKGIGRAVTVGTETMGLGAAVFPLRLDRTGITINYSAEPVYDVEDRPRWKLKPDVPVPPSGDILAAGLAELKRLASR